ncbi:hypothetical protein BT93_D1863 [Corymbia citriodora subsp. variegata]|nr:hypothetical protein BT93_D1863 [Corymbia citriodora subsp. variegata]
MLVGFGLAVIGALLRLWVVSVSSFPPSQSSSSSLASAAALGALRFMLLCGFRPRSNLVPSSASMRLRPRRTCSGVECFGGFHIKRFSNLFLFLRGGLT